jgi:hypothetical protein
MAKAKELTPKQRMARLTKLCGDWTRHCKAFKLDASDGLTPGDMAVATAYVRRELGVVQEIFVTLERAPAKFRASVRA